MVVKYKKSKASYPDGLLAIYDNEGTTADRYTVVYEPWEFVGRLYFPITNMSGSPFHPQGVCMHGGYYGRPTKQSGEKLIELADLPDDCQKVVRQDLAP